MTLTIGSSYLVRFGPPEIPARCKWSPAIYVGPRPYRGAERHTFQMGAGYSYTTIEPARDVRPQ
jgi:hypothetical protein